MKFTKILALILAMILCTSMFTACLGGGNDDLDDDEEIEEEEDKKDKDDEDEEEDNNDKDDEDEDVEVEVVPDDKPQHDHDSSDKEDKPNNNKPGNDKEEKPSAKPDDGYTSADFKGEDFTFLVLQQTTGNNKDYYGGNYIDSDCLTGLTVEDAVYKRNLAVEERYNVNITQRIEDVNSAGDPVQILTTFAMAGDYSFDAIYGWGNKMGACIVENLLGDISSLPYVDLGKSYWNPSTLDDLSVNNKLYIAASDISMSTLDWSSMLFFNQRIVEDYNLESKVGNFYDLVREGKWTFDKYLEAIQSVSTDVDGDGAINAYDVYGLISGTASGYSTGLSCGVQLTAKNEDGSYSLAFYDETLIDLATKINAVYSDSKYVKPYDELMYAGDSSAFGDIFEYSRSFFGCGHSLFLEGTPYIASELRAMDDDYGILPMPKRDENQAEYISIVDSNAAVIAIPSTYRTDVSEAGPERTGLILEYMAYQSNQILTPKYYDQLIKRQSLNTEEDQQMLSIVHSSAHYVFSDMIGLYDISDLCNQMFVSPNSASSMYRSRSTKLQKALDDFYSSVLTLD